MEAARALLDGLPETLVYHDRAHTLEVVLPAAERLAADEGLDPHTAELVAIAAAFHDTGFLETYSGHEEASAHFAEQAMRTLGFDAEDIAQVRAMILATHMPQMPRTQLERIMADADLDVLGRDDFAAHNQRLREELAGQGTVFEDDAWFEEQAAFLRGHRYFTAAARKRRDAGKVRNLARLEALQQGTSNT